MSFSPTMRSDWPRVIMIHGLMESGKSTLASYFMDVHGYNRVKFADPLKNMVRTLLARVGVPADMIERYVEGDLKKTPIPELNDPAKPENHLENLGDDGVRALLVSLLTDCGMSEREVSDHLYGSSYETPIRQVQSVTTARRLFETLRNEWSQTMLKDEIIIPRRLMQTLGEEWRNLHSPRLWAQIARAQTQSVLDSGSDVIVDDNRYLFELQEFAELRPMSFVTTRGNKHFLPITDDIHPGERPMPVGWFDAHLDNNGTREALWQAAVEILDARAQFERIVASVKRKSKAPAYGLGQRQFDVA